MAPEPQRSQISQLHWPFQQVPPPHTESAQVPPHDLPAMHFDPGGGQEGPGQMSSSSGAPSHRHSTYVPPSVQVPGFMMYSSI